MCSSIHPLFGIERVVKRFSRLNRRRESVAFSPHIKLSSAKLLHASEILYLRSQMLRTARYGVLYEIKLFWRKCYFLYSHAVNRTYFSDQLAYGKMTLLNFSFLFGWCKVKFFLYFIFANGFHFPKLPFVLNFHSLLRHLHISEFAVLLFDCERYKLAAQSIP